MTLHRVRRLALLLLAGGMLFQAGTCAEQTAGVLGTTLIPALASAANLAITDKLQGDETTPNGSISPPGGGPFDAVNNAIQGLRNNLGVQGSVSSTAGA